MFLYPKAAKHRDKNSNPRLDTGAEKLHATMERYLQQHGNESALHFIRNKANDAQQIESKRRDGL